VEGLKDEFDFKIICGDRDAGDREPFATEPIGRWYELGSAKVLRVPPGPAGARMLIQALRRESYDVLYINGVWPRMFSMLPLACRWTRLLPQKPVVLAPRGEFSKGSLSIKSNRKLLYLKLSAWLGFYRGVIWHASTNLEEAAIRRSMGDIPGVDSSSFLHGESKVCQVGVTGAIVVAKNMYVMPERHGEKKTRKLAGQLRGVFVSRISPEKNLLYAFGLLASLSGKVVFDIYGPVGNAGYWNECKKAISALPPNVQVNYTGTIEHERVAEVFAGHDLFLFPTLGENFGHVICEALNAGCPVLVSDQTPWRNLEEMGASAPFCSNAWMLTGIGTPRLQLGLLNTGKWRRTIRQSWKRTAEC
jgi:glycosyltransferase involved in cell wall biosynthesis